MRCVLVLRMLGSTACVVSGKTVLVGILSYVISVFDATYIREDPIMSMIEEAFYVRVG